MLAVLGTPVEEARDDDRSRTLLLSDLHVPDPASPASAASRVLQDLGRLVHDAMRDGHATRILILGDLFDAWVGPRQLACAGGRAVVELLREAGGAGVSISVLHGNRDFMLDEAFARQARCRVVPGGLRFHLRQRVCLALHGDELCLRDLPYQRSKRWLRHPVTRALLRNLPLRASMALAGKARRESKRTIAAGDQARFTPPAQALQAAFALGADLLVFGHVHRPARGLLAGGGEYCVLPAFDAGGVHLEHVDGVLRYRDAGGNVLPDPPAQVFL